MKKVAICDRAGAAVGEIEIAESRLTLDRGAQAVHDVVTALMAGRRAGTASTLEKGDVAGSRGKPWRQKGLGRARAGYKTSPLWRGGGTVFGPHPRSFAKKVPRKVRDLAFRRALSEKIASGALRIVENLDFETVKTRDFAAALTALGITGPVLLAPAQLTDAQIRASRNLPGVETTRAKDINVYQILRYPVLLTDRAGWAALEQRLPPAEDAAE